MAAGDYVNGLSYHPYLRGGEVRKYVSEIRNLDHLEGEMVMVQTYDGEVHYKLYEVIDGVVTLDTPAVVIHAGLPYYGTIQFLPLGDTAQGITGQTKSRKLYKVVLRVFKSAGGKFGKDMDSIKAIPYDADSLHSAKVGPWYTGDITLDFESSFDKYWSPLIYIDAPAPFMLLAAVFDSDVEDDH